MPTSQAPKPTPMNRATLVPVTGTPTARAAAASPPTAKTQLPTRVRSSSHDTSAVSTIQ